MHIAIIFHILLISIKEIYIVLQFWNTFQVQNAFHQSESVRQASTCIRRDVGRFKGARYFLHLINTLINAR